TKRLGATGTTFIFVPYASRGAMDSAPRRGPPVQTSGAADPYRSAGGKRYAGATAGASSRDEAPPRRRPRPLPIWRDPDRACRRSPPDLPGLPRPAPDTRPRSRSVVARASAPRHGILDRFATSVAAAAPGHLAASPAAPGLRRN